MNDAMPLFGLAAVLWGVAVVAWTVGRLWLRAKELERGNAPSLTPATESTAIGLLARVEARLERLEQTAETTAIEVERLAEAQRFTARLAASAHEASTEGVPEPSNGRTTR